MGYCCDVSADGGYCACLTPRMEKTLPPTWKIVRPTLIPDQWLACERVGGLAALFLIHWHEEGLVWHKDKTILDLSLGDLTLLQDVLS